MPWSPLPDWQAPPPLTRLVEIPLEEVRLGDHVLVNGWTLPVRNMFTIHRRPGIPPGKHLVFPHNLALTVAEGSFVKVRRKNV